MGIEEQDQPAGGLDRRSLLKKGAIGGAIAWTAPAILSSPAFAQTASPFDDCVARACGNRIGLTGGGNTRTANPDFDGECFDCPEQPAETFSWAFTWTGPGTVTVNPPSNSRTPQVIFSGLPTSAGSATLTLQGTYTVRCGGKIAAVTVTTIHTIAWNASGVVTSTTQGASTTTNACPPN